MQKASIEIAATPDKVYAFMTDPAQLPKWQPDADDVELQLATKTKNERLTYRIEDSRLSALMEFKLVQWGYRTRVVNIAAMRPKGWLRALFPLVKGMIRRRMESRLQLLRQAVEGA